VSLLAGAAIQTASPAIFPVLPIGAICAEVPQPSVRLLADWDYRRYRAPWGRALRMKRTGILLGLVCVGFVIVSPVTLAAEGKGSFWRYNAHSPEPPFPRSKRAESIWASDWCWSDCGSYCAWGLAGCLKEDSQGRCLKLTDKCDRYCQRACRTRGGPLLPIEFPWD
jgi:hypothetical protein